MVSLSLLENTQITRIACRRLAVTDKSDLALLAWTQEAKIQARGIETKPINIKGLISVMPDIRKMTLKKTKDFCFELKWSCIGIFTTFERSIFTRCYIYRWE